MTSLALQAKRPTKYASQPANQPIYSTKEMLWKISQKLQWNTCAGVLF